MMCFYSAVTNTLSSRKELREDCSPVQSSQLFPVLGNRASGRSSSSSYPSPHCRLPVSRLPWREQMSGTNHPTNMQSSVFSGSN